jgi:hypothetical protein
MMAAMTEGMAAIMSPTMLENMSTMLSSIVFHSLLLFLDNVYKTVSRVLVLVEGLSFFLVFLCALGEYRE